VHPAAVKTEFLFEQPEKKRTLQKYLFQLVKKLLLIFLHKMGKQKTPLVFCFYKQELIYSLLQEDLFWIVISGNFENE